MFGSPETYFDLAKQHHRELVHEADQERVARRLRHHGRKHRQAHDRTAR